MRIQILPSLLAADNGCLAAEARRAEQAGGDALHIDIMDGHFVPNLSFGPDVVRMARNVVKIPLNVHLMLTRPQDYVDRFVEAGADAISIHVEADCDVSATLEAIRAHGIEAAVTVKPATPAEAVRPYLDQVSYVLVMTVEPGYGGQAFMADMMPKVADIRAVGGSDFGIMVDGGVNAETAAVCAAAGANMLVAGNSLFTAPDMQVGVAEMRRVAAAHWMKGAPAGA